MVCDHLESPETLPSGASLRALASSGCSRACVSRRRVAPRSFQPRPHLLISRSGAFEVVHSLTLSFWANLNTARYTATRHITLVRPQRQRERDAGEIVIESAFILQYIMAYISDFILFYQRPARNWRYLKRSIRYDEFG